MRIVVQHKFCNRICSNVPNVVFTALRVATAMASDSIIYLLF